VLRVILISLLCLIVLPFYSKANDYAPRVDAQQQKIKLLSNRFRVDQTVDAIIFIIERKPGTAPIILVQPDGTKLYAIREVEGVKWADGLSGDMIEIMQPMIGPWQIIGDILPSSEIRLATSLELKIDDFPSEIFADEQIKLTSRIEFNNKLLKLGRVDDLINLEVSLKSKNIRGEQNFGAGKFTIGRYVDNGINLDERKGDGVFTGYLDLDKPLGPYIMQIRASNKVFEREHVQDLLIRAQPVKVDLISAAIDGHYALRFITNEEAVRLSEMAIQVVIHHPDGTQEYVSVTGLAPVHILKLENVMKPGRYRIDVEVLGTTTTGREFKYDVKQLKAKIEIPAEKEMQTQKIEADKERKLKFERDLLAKKRKEARQKAENKHSLVIVAVMINAFILLGGAIMVGIFLFKKGVIKLPKKKPKKKKDVKKDDKKSDKEDDKKDDKEDKESKEKK